MYPPKKGLCAMPFTEPALRCVDHFSPCHGVSFPGFPCKNEETQAHIGK